MKTCFYDIESLENIFTCALYRPDTNTLDLFYIDDDGFIAENYDYFIQNLGRRILDANQNLRRDIKIMIYNLSHLDGMHVFAQHFPLFDDSSTNARLVLDVETHKEGHDLYYMGYNSYNYDTTELAMLFEECYKPIYQNTLEGRVSFMYFTGTSAKQMRIRNDELFSEQFKNRMSHRLTYGPYDPRSRSYGHQDWDARPRRIRAEWLKTGRYLDVARLNEKQSMLALKRVLGILGYQILESNRIYGKPRVYNIKDVIDLFAYNVSDVVNLEKLFLHPVYSARAELTQMMLKEYPELIFNKKYNSYEPDTYVPGSPRTPNIRKDRMCIDSSSAQIATNVLCPYGNLDDIETVSFLYPSEQKSKELGIPRVDVLEESKRFFCEKFKDYPEALEAFNQVYAFYSSIRGKNFNSGNNYKKKYGNHMKAYTLKTMPQPNTNLFYYNKDGTPSTCFATMSTGGAHGQEVAYSKYREDLREYEYNQTLLASVKENYPLPTDLAKAKVFTYDYKEYKASKFLKAKSNMTRGEYRDALGDIPTLFKTSDKGKFTLDKKYTYTSCLLVNHEDFKSYYPLLLVMLSAFVNEGLGYDRYSKLYDLKEEYGRLEKSAEKAGKSEEAYRFDLLREGVKLILNSATGAGDTEYSSNIQMNNQIISMRIIGQLFSWRVGQEQTYHGARIPSTNTDGLYSAMDETLNNQILEEVQKHIHVDIKPEQLYLISKDSNTRMELTANKAKVLSAAGNGLACRKGPDPRYALSRPAILDWALSIYLVNFGADAPFDYEKGMAIIRMYDEENKLLMFQNIISSKPSMRRFIYGERNLIDGESWSLGDSEQPVILQHYNRVFYLKNKTEQTLHLRAAVARKIVPKTFAKRERDNEPRVQNNPLASKVLQENHANIPSLHDEHETTIVKITGTDPTLNCLVVNNDLHQMTNIQIEDLYNQLDFEAYVKLLQRTYEDNWQNHVPNEYVA